MNNRVKTGFWQQKHVQQLIKKVILYVILSVGGIVFLIPFIWMVSTSLKIPSQVWLFPPKWIPEPIVWRNYVDGFKMLSFGVYFKNSIIVTAGAMIGGILSSSLVGFGFARLKARHKDLLFLLVISTMLLPPQVTMIPVFILFRMLGWVGTFKPLIIPAYFGGGAFFIFLFKQFLQSIPRELDDSARVDGCNTLTIYWRIILPLAKPALATVAIFSFFGHWNDFMGPLIYLNDNAKYTIALGLRLFQGQFYTLHLEQLMAMSILALLPCIVVFFVAQNYFVRGIVLTGLKG